jgi:hypothetical protein
MINREKVIKGLELCLTGDASVCKDCPYEAECEATIGAGPSPLRHDALTLLKEQEPIAPVYDQLLTQEIPRCGKCGYRLVKGKDKYCCMCGKEVKWND